MRWRNISPRCIAALVPLTKVKDTASTRVTSLCALAQSMIQSFSFCCAAQSAASCGCSTTLRALKPCSRPSRCACQMSDDIDVVQRADDTLEQRLAFPLGFAGRKRGNALEHHLVRPGLVLGEHPRRLRVHHRLLHWLNIAVILSASAERPH